jgi:hypothetical protein
MAKRKSKVPGTDDEIEIEDAPDGRSDDHKEAAFINQQADLMEGRVVENPVPEGTVGGEPPPPPETIFGQTNQTYDGEADPAIIIKARNKLRVYEQSGTPVPGGVPEIPTLTLLEPNEAEVGGSDVELKVHGTAFTADTVILFNNGEEDTTQWSDTLLTTIVRPSTASGAAVVPVSVRNLSGESNHLEFEFFEYEPVSRSDEDEDKPKTKKGKKGK